MIIVIHIIIAVSSLLFSGFTFVYPSKRKLNIVYGLVAATLFTGFYLVLSKPANLTQTCITGLSYLGIVFAAIFATRHKLARMID